jgi:adenosylcobyric acid synthase
MAKTLMIQGTGSGAGKSLIAAAFCRIFRDMGLNVAPFKAQNMALNSYITVEGGEIGRAQALQAEAAGVEPSVHMNPVLLKTSGETGSQVILQGKVHATMKARDYYAFKKEVWKTVRKSFAVLSRQYDMIVMEGAGSPAEINLLDVDIVNMSMAKHARAPVILVGDIDKGGVFASLYGTVKLLGRDSRFIKGFLINKFRGDVEILRPGFAMIEAKTGVPVIGVLPFASDLGLPEEDGVALYTNSRYHGPSGRGSIRVVVVRLKFISNFTDFDPLFHESDVDILFSTSGADIENADLVIIPGTKNTVKDLVFLKECGLDTHVMRAAEKGVAVMGICGGYQMLGRKIYDPDNIESPYAEMDGLGLLDIETTFTAQKSTRRVEAAAMKAGPESGYPLKGYEIHMGDTTGNIGLFRVRSLFPAAKISKSYLDGSKKGNCWGTYLHGIFDNDAFRRDLINGLRMRRGLPPFDQRCSYSAVKEQAIINLADLVKNCVDMSVVKEMIGL